MPFTYGEYGRNNHSTNLCGLDDFRSCHLQIKNQIEEFILISKKTSNKIVNRNVQLLKIAT